MQACVPNIKSYQSIYRSGKGEYGKRLFRLIPTRKQITGSAEEILTIPVNMCIRTILLYLNLGCSFGKDERTTFVELFPTVAETFLRAQKYLTAHPEKTQEVKEDSEDVQQSQSKKNAKQGNIMTSPMPGNIMDVLVNEGDEVKRGDALVILESMKMENEIPSEFSGKVVRIYVRKGDNVRGEQPLVEVV